MRMPYRLSLAPLAVIAVVVTTAVPVEFRGEAEWSLRFEWGDLLQNILLYVPLGVALNAWSLWRVTAVAAALSLGIEATQLWSVERFASPPDILYNTLGTVLAAVAYRHTAWARSGGPVTVDVTRARLLLALLILGLQLNLWRIVDTPSDLSNWDPEYSLLVGNERTGGRPWRGEVRDLRIYAVPLSSAEVARLTAGATLDGVDPIVELAAPIASDGGSAIELPAEATRTFATAAMSANSFTILFTMATPFMGQEGPARIITFSGDTLHRNFDVGQDGRRVVLRIRTPGTGLNGDLRRSTTRPKIRVSEDLRIAATYDGSIARLYVEGVLDDRSDLSAAGCTVSLVCDESTPLHWALGAGLLTIVVLAFVPTRGPLHVWLVCGLSAGALLTVAMLLPVAPRIGRSSGVIPIVTMLGAAAIALARNRAVREGSVQRSLATSR